MANDWPEIEIKGERPITDNTDYDSFHRAKKKIVHYLITVRGGTVDGHDQALIFEAQYKGTHKEDASFADVVQYCTTYAKNGSERNPDIRDTPLDMKVWEQCWLVVELDKRVNWHFARGSRACTSKHGDPDHGGGRGHNVWLRHVYKNGDALEKTNEDDVGSDGCRVLFFGVAHRGHPKRSTTPHHYFNLKIEFFQTSDGRSLVLPVVLDPDVGNDGQDQIPPP